MSGVVAWLPANTHPHSTKTCAEVGFRGTHPQLCRAMAPSAAGTVSPSLATRQILGQCDDISRRLSIWGEAHHPRDEPLTVLLRNHTKTLAAEVQSLKALVFGHQLADGDNVPTEIVRAVASIKFRLVESLEIHGFHSREERQGHDGALNALFAARFILSDIAFPGTARAYYNEDKLTHIGLELKDLVQEVLPALVGGGTFSPAASPHFL